MLLDAGAGHTNYLWSTGDTTQTIYASAAGTYNVTVGNGTPVSNSNSLLFDPNWLNPVGEIPDVSNLNTIGDKITIMAWVKTFGDMTVFSNSTLLADTGLHSNHASAAASFHFFELARTVLHM